MQARYYDPVIGRFYSNDPVDAVSHFSNEEGIKGFNRYSYAVNNPYKYTDPDGKAICGGACIVAAIGIREGAKACAKNATCRSAVSSGLKKATTGVKRIYSAIMGVFGESSSEESETPDEEKSEEEIREEKRARRQETIDDYADGYLPDVHDNHGMEGENNRKEDQEEPKTERDEDNS